MNWEGRRGWVAKRPSWPWAGCVGGWVMGRIWTLGLMGEREVEEEGIKGQVDGEEEGEWVRRGRERSAEVV